MVYKKYLKKGGKTFGPYYYESYRDGEHVKKRYIGDEKEYRDWLLKKKKVYKKSYVEQHTSLNKVNDSSKLLFVLVLFALAFIIFWNIGTFVNVPMSLSGFVVSENVSELESSSLYGSYQEEAVEQTFDTSSVDLEIKEPASFNGEAITKNKNKKMEFDLGDGNLILYFDLLDYSDFVDEVDSIIKQEKTPEEVTNYIGSEESEESEEIEIQVEIPEEITENETPVDETPTEEVTEESPVENTETLVEENLVEETPVEAPTEPIITGNIIKGINAKVISEDKADLREVKKEIEKLKEKEIDVIEEKTKTEAKDFDIVVDEAKVDEEQYKWGYKVRLNSLNFMAKIDVTTDKELSVFDDSSLMIGNQILSFQDLIDAGYTVKIEKPTLEMEVIEEKTTIDEETTEDITEEITIETTNESVEETSVEEIPMPETPAETTTEEVIEEVPTEETPVEEVPVDTGITGNIVRAFRGMTGNIIKTVTPVADIENEKLKNTIKIYIERDFTNSGYDVGDIVYLDPSLVTISYAVINANNFTLINLTSSKNGTINHLNISTAAPYDALYLYHSFDVNEGTVIDSWDNKGTASSTGTAVYNTTACIFGSCRTFGTGKSLSNTDSDLIFTNTQDYTWMAWIRRDNYNNGVLFDFGDIGASSSVGGNVAIGNIYDFNTINLCVQDYDGYNIYYADTTTIIPENWYHIAVTYDYNAGSAQISLYVNGVQENSENAMPLLTDTSGGIALEIGTGDDLDDSGYYPFKGNMDEIMVFKSALSEENIAAIYNNQSARFLGKGQMNKIQAVNTGTSNVNVTANYGTILGSALNLSLSYQNSSGWFLSGASVFTGNNNFSIPGNAFNVSANFSFFAGPSGYQFYSPIIYTTTGNLNVTLTELSALPNLTRVYPTTNIDATQNQFFNVTINASCVGDVGGVCGAINVSLINVLPSIVDGSFESTLSDNWDINDGGVVMQSGGTAKTGSNALNLNVAKGTGTNAIAWQNMGDIYASKLCYWLKGDIDTNYKLNVSYKNSAGSWIGSVITGVSYGSWTQICNEISLSNLPVKGVKIEVIDALSWDTYASFDDICFADSIGNCLPTNLLVNKSAGGIPFYVNTTNPIETSSLSVGQSQIVTFWINASYSILNSNYAFYAFANRTDMMNVNNMTNQWNVSIIAYVAPDITYPIFSNYYDNNASVYNSGVGLFNVTLANTNGTVLLEINNTNLTATNLTANVYNVSYTFTNNGTYSYKWHSWGNGTSHNYNVSATGSYTILSDITVPIISLTAPVNNSNFNITSITFNISGSEALNWCGLSINGNANVTMTLNSATTAGYINTSIADGSYTFIITCNDSANNYGNTGINRFLKDATTSTLSIALPLSNFNYNTNLVPINASAIDTASNVSVFNDYGLVSWWRMDDLNSSGDVVDYIGTNNGKRVNAMQTASGKMGKAMSFDGVGDWLITSPILFYNTENYTYSFWVKRNTTTNYEGILEIGSYVSGKGISITIGSYELGEATKVYISNIKREEYINSVAGIGTDWTYIVVRYTGNDKADIYINGELDTNQGNLGFMSSSILLGAYLGGNVEDFYSDVNYLNGKLDDVMIFNRSLSVEEIQALYANQTTKYLNSSVPMAEGTRDIKIFSQDSAGNIASATSYNVNVDTILPGVSIVYPINNNYSINVNAINYTSSGASYCWYSLNGGVLNSSAVEAGINWTGLSSSEGSNTWRIYCNDSANNLNSSSITFIKDTIYPQISIIIPTNNTNSSNTGLDVNYSVSDTNLQLCWYSNDTMTSNTTLASCANITTITWAEGQHNVTIWANDSAGNINSSFVRFTIDTTAPSFTAIANQSMYNNESLSYDLNASDSGVGVQSFAINWTNTFSIDSNGVLTNTSALSVQIYYINLSINDSLNNLNSQVIYVNVSQSDMTYPLISYGDGTANDSARVWQNYVYANVSVTEANLKNITFRLYNGTNGLLNTTNYSSAVYTINWTGLAGGDYKYNVTICDIANLCNSTTTRNIFLIESQENITLNAGWNLISLGMNNTDTGTDRNISLARGWNLIGYSSDTSLNLANANFTNSSGSKYTWTNAVANNKVQAYGAYYDSSSATASQRKYKYLGTSGVDKTAFENKKGYWIYANQSGNLTLPGVGGSLAGQTYQWSKLRFVNSSGSEKNITEAGSAGWISTTLKYWDNGFKNLRYDSEDPEIRSYISPYEGVFIKSNYNNITMIRQN
ncbi:MAG: LamG domain-containing protein [Candidatus Pacearchaeota archaeon]